MSEFGTGFGCSLYVLIFYTCYLQKLSNPSWHMGFLEASNYYKKTRNFMTTFPKQFSSTI